MNHWFTADIHCFDSNILKYFNRIESSDIIKNKNFVTKTINNYVNENDVLWVLGDLTNKKTSIRKNIKSILSKIKCKNVHLILGNHDNRDSVKDLFLSCNDIQYCCINIFTGEYVLGWDLSSKVSLEKGWFGFVLSHYPLLSWPNSHLGWINLYGHSHGKLEKWANKNMPDRRSTDVGFDYSKILTGDHKPFSLSNIISSVGSNKGYLIDY